MTAKLSREFKIDKQCRTFSAWSQVVSLLFAQLTHSIGLNDVCDALRLHKAKLGWEPFVERFLQVVIISPMQTRIEIAI